MKKRFQLSIRQGVWFSFAFVLILSGIAVVSALGSFHEAADHVQGITQYEQPLLERVLSLEKEIGDALVFYSFHYLHHEKRLLESGRQALERARADLDALKALLAAYPGRAQLLEQIVRDMTALGERLEEGASIAQDPLKTYPGRRIATKQVNPRAQEILQLIGEMIASERDETAASPDRLPMLNLLEDLRYHFVTLVTRVRSFLAVRAQGALEDIRTFRELVVRDIERARTSAIEPTFEEEEGMGRLKELLPDYFEALDAMIRIHTQPRWRMDAWYVEHRVAPVAQALHGKLDRLVTLATQDLSAGNRTLLDQVAHSGFFMSGALMVMLAFGILAAFMTGRRIGRLVDSVREALSRAAEGDFTRELDESAAGELGEINRRINRFSERMRELLIRIRQAASVLDDASGALEVYSSKANEIVQDEHERIAQTACAMTQMVASSREIAGNAASVANTTNEVRERTDGEKADAFDMRQGMQRLAEQVRDSSDVIRRLGQESRNIGTVIDVIQGIAEQTNLLALNAAIEAARAGEQGRGFAVVADEVRGLANRTRQSTGEIQHLIEQLQEGARNAEGMMEEVETGVFRYCERMEEMAASLDGIAQAVSDVSDRITQIAAAAEEQNAASAEINENVSAIRALAEQASEGAEQTRKAGSDIRSISRDLKDRVAFFRLDAS